MMKSISASRMVGLLELTEPRPTHAHRRSTSHGKKKKSDSSKLSLASPCRSRSALFRRPAMTSSRHISTAANSLVFAFDLTIWASKRLGTSNDPALGATHPSPRCSVERFSGWRSTAGAAFSTRYVSAVGRVTSALHLPVTLTVERPFGTGTFWMRLDHLLARPPRFPVVPTAFIAHPRRSTARRRMARSRITLIVALDWWRGRGMRTTSPTAQLPLF